MESTRIGERTEREANSLPQYTPNFDPYRNSPWRARHVALGQFQQAARTILIRIRAEDRLSKLRKLMKVSWNFLIDNNTANHNILVGE